MANRVFRFVETRTLETMHLTRNRMKRACVYAF